MEILALFIGLTVTLGLSEINSGLSFSDSGKQMAHYTQDRAGALISPDVSSVTCKLRGSPHLPAFSMDGDYTIGGVFSIHYNIQTVKHNYTTMPEPLRCTGRLVSGIHTYYSCNDGFHLYSKITVAL